MKVAMLGTGYVGLVTGVCFAEAGHEVSAVDSDQGKIKKLGASQLPFYEPGLDDLFQRNQKRMKFYTDIGPAVENADVVFVAVGTPELECGNADMSYTFNVLEEVCRTADSDKIIVLKSTVPIGSSEKVKAFCRENCRYHMEVVNNPEFLRQGSAVEDFTKPDRVVIGCDSEKARVTMKKLYEPFLKNGRPILFMDNTSAEMTKYAANAFLAMKISFVNELALLADKLGADITKVREGFTSDHRIHPSFFLPGIGYGGSCFPKDVRALYQTGQEENLDMLLLKATDDVNERQKTVLAGQLFDHFGDLNGKRICLWGLAFKPKTDDVRRAPSIKLIENLVNQGARVCAYDPVAVENARKSCSVEFETAESAMEATSGADALVIVTEWTEFRSPDFKKLKENLKKPLVFDGRNIFEPEKMREWGFEYYAIGRHIVANGNGSRKKASDKPMTSTPAP